MAVVRGVSVVLLGLNWGLLASAGRALGLRVGIIYCIRVRVKDRWWSVILRLL